MEIKPSYFNVHLGVESQRLPCVKSPAGLLVPGSWNPTQSSLSGCHGLSLFIIGIMWMFVSAYETSVTMMYWLTVCFHKENFMFQYPYFAGMIYLSTMMVLNIFLRIFGP